MTYSQRFSHIRKYLELQISGFIAPYRSSAGRKFFIAENGCVGLCPMVAAVGDHIRVVSRACVPFVLRDTVDDAADVYTLIGGCYVHDLMDGKALTLPGDFKPFMIV